MSAAVVSGLCISSGLVVYLLNSHFQSPGQQRHPVAQTLPPELLLFIFELVSSSDAPGIRSSLPPLMRVCKAWYKVSTPLLYRTIVLRTFSAARSLINALQANPQLGHSIISLAIQSQHKSPIQNLISYFLPDTGPLHLDTALGDLLPLCTHIHTVALVADHRAVERTTKRLSLGADVFVSAGIHLTGLRIVFCDISTNSVFSAGKDRDFPFPQLRSLHLYHVYLGRAQRFPRIPHLEELTIISPTFGVEPSTTSRFVLSISQRSFPVLGQLKLSLSDICRQPIVKIDKPLVNGLKSLDLDATVSRDVVLSWLDKDYTSNMESLSLGRQWGDSRDISLPSLPIKIRDLKLAVEVNASALTALTKFLGSLPSALRNSISIERLTLESVTVEYFHRESGEEWVVDSDSFKSSYDNVIEEIRNCCRSQRVSFVHIEKQEISFKGCIRAQ
ncbi:hypothetical protein NLI96_g4858 [Meripilus lineatus]|uniref:F-box domain-containing protein n=1 Tax=Meripilus lineatus TaxID=2056292 RepID=A0AAD5V612_9APHY|nr:hypothetical protein NLI96_g4858 [Physisporinus lineatus]